MFPNIEISLSQQCMYFLWSVLLGAAVGVLYDIFRILRIALPHNGVSVFFEDILFCVITCCMLILMIFCANYGIVRWFAVMGCAGGFMLYRETVGKVVIGAAERIILFFRKYIISPVVSLAAYIISIAARLIKYIAAALISLSIKLRIKLFFVRIVRHAGKGFGL